MGRSVTGVAGFWKGEPPQHTRLENSFNLVLSLNKMDCSSPLDSTKASTAAWGMKVGVGVRRVQEPGVRASLKLLALAPGVVPREVARRQFLASSSWPLPELIGQVLGIVMGTPYARTPCLGDLPTQGMYILLRVVGITES